MDYVYLILLTILGGFVLGVNISLRVLYQRLEESHEEKWEALGKPRLTVRGGRTGRGTRAFIWKREYLLLGDPVVTRLGNRIRLLDAGLIVVFVAFLLVLLVFR